MPEAFVDLFLLLYAANAVCRGRAVRILTQPLMPKAQVISLIQMKGGVGKTTCAVNLASYLAKDHQKRVLLVDFDPQTNATLSLISAERWRAGEKDHGTRPDVRGAEHKRKGGETGKLPDCTMPDQKPAPATLHLPPAH